jgi:nicotinamidase-related amidase
VTRPWLLLAALGAAGCAASREPGVLAFEARRLDKSEPLRWKAGETAVIVCDMWDDHTCAGAARRVAAFAPRLDAFLKHCRAEGALIVHAPSDTMKFYEGTPQRRRAREAPPVEPPVPIQSRRLDPAREGQLPVDDSDWCDCRPKCPVEATAKKGWPWTRQIASIEIAEGDAVSDSGREIYNLFRARGVKNVILTGVHTNMCVLGRSFGIRQMTMLGMNVALARDLTDCLYDPAKPPHVSHDRGTELIVEHIERHWCASFSAADLIESR